MRKNQCGVSGLNQLNGCGARSIHEIPPVAGVRVVFNGFRRIAGSSTRVADGKNLCSQHVPSDSAVLTSRVV